MRRGLVKTNSLPRSLALIPAYLRIVTIWVRRSLSVSYCLPPGPEPLHTIILRARGLTTQLPGSTL